MKILINESDVDIRRLYQVIFSPLNVELTFTDNAVETRGAADRVPYDLVMMDVEYPTMDGLSEARRMMDEKPERPLLVVSSVPLQESDLGDRVSRSRSAVMMKPFNIRELRSTIQNLVETNLPRKNGVVDYLQPTSVN